jgi:hypothetical protein
MTVRLAGTTWNRECKVQCATAARKHHRKPFNFWRILMKLVQSLFVAALIAAPAISFAQSNQPLTRAQVRAELVELQQAGYDPASDNTQYPKNIEAALSRVQAQKDASYGGIAAGQANSDSRHDMAQAPAAQQNIIGLEPIYAHS